MSKADELLAKETLTRDEVLDLLMESKREWAEAAAPPLTVTPGMLRRLISEYAEAYCEFTGEQVTPVLVQRLLAAVFTDTALCSRPDLAEIYRHPVETDAETSGRRVLAIDDDPTVLVLISQLLRRDGLIVVTAESGPEGLLKFQRGHFDLVLLDYDMPCMSGLEVCAKLKEKMADAPATQGRMKRAPVVFLTGKTEKAHVIAAVQAGGDGYIAKPFELPELIANVRKYLPVADGGKTK